MAKPSQSGKASFRISRGLSDELEEHRKVFQEHPSNTAFIKVAIHEKMVRDYKRLELKAAALGLPLPVNPTDDLVAAIDLKKLKRMVDDYDV